MAERLTVSGATTQRDIDKLLELSNENQFGRNEAYYKLQHYEDLEEAGRLIIVPESFNVKTAVECITEKFCPSTFGLNNYTERCGHDDCKGCWEAALKEVDE